MLLRSCLGGGFPWDGELLGCWPWRWFGLARLHHVREQVRVLGQLLGWSLLGLGDLGC